MHWITGNHLFSSWIVIVITTISIFYWHGHWLLAFMDNLFLTILRFLGGPNVSKHFSWYMNFSGFSVCEAAFSLTVLTRVCTMTMCQNQRSPMVISWSMCVPHLKLRQSLVATFWACNLKRTTCYAISDHQIKRQIFLKDDIDLPKMTQLFNTSVLEAYNQLIIFNKKGVPKKRRIFPILDIW